MATLSSSRFGNLIERLLYSQRGSPHAAAKFARHRFPTVRLLLEAQLPTPGKADDAWLQRLELRGDERVIRTLDADGFRGRTGTMEALFVDDRCGLIRSQRIGATASIDPDRAVADILRLAANCLASGIVLATNDPSGAIARAPRWRKFTMDLHRKGEAIEVFLLDHFILTAAGWRRMFALNGKKRN